jgi:hypothetical protein
MKPYPPRKILCALSRHLLSGLELRTRTRTSQRSFSTEFGGQRTVRATPHRRQNPTDPHRCRSSSLLTTHPRDLAGKIRHRPLVVLPPVPLKTVHRSDIAAFTEKSLPAEAVVSRASLDQRLRLDHRIPFVLIKI